MNPTDKQRVLKLLNLTTSSNDHEALVAMRKANAILAENKVLWDNFGETKTQLPRSIFCRDDPYHVAEAMLQEIEKWNWSNPRAIDTLKVSVQRAEMNLQHLTELFEFYKKALVYGLQNKK